MVLADDDSSDGHRMGKWGSMKRSSICQQVPVAEMLAQPLPSALCPSPRLQMLAVSTGKLVRYLVEDGGHIQADAPYAEMEVMKMVMTLMAPASGGWAGWAVWAVGLTSTLAPSLLGADA
jgi:hypothetical protein